MEKRLRKASLTQALAKQVLEQAHVLEQLAKKKKEANEEIPLRKGYTFKLESSNPFRPEPVYKIMEEVINEGMENFYYNPKEATDLCRKFAFEIRKKSKCSTSNDTRSSAESKSSKKTYKEFAPFAPSSGIQKEIIFCVFKFDKFDLFVVAYVFAVYHE